MKLTQYLREKCLDDETFASLSSGAFSPEAVRKWRFGVRIPRPEQMRLIFELTQGAVTPNDFVGVASDALIDRAAS
jgi:hypothetical protein